MQKGRKTRIIMAGGMFNLILPANCEMPNVRESRTSENAKVAKCYLCDFLFIKCFLLHAIMIACIYYSGSSLARVWVTHSGVADQRFQMAFRYVHSVGSAKSLNLNSFIVKWVQWEAKENGNGCDSELPSSVLLPFKPQLQWITEKWISFSHLYHQHQQQNALTAYANGIRLQQQQQRQWQWRHSRVHNIAWRVFISLTSIGTRHT